MRTRSTGGRLRPVYLPEILRLRLKNTRPSRSPIRHQRQFVSTCWLSTRFAVKHFLTPHAAYTIDGKSAVLWKSSRHWLNALIRFALVVFVFFWPLLAIAYLPVEIRASATAFMTLHILGAAVTAYLWIDLFTQQIEDRRTFNKWIKGAAHKSRSARGSKIDSVKKRRTRQSWEIRDISFASADELRATLKAICRLADKKKATIYYFADSETDSELLKFFRFRLAYTLPNSGQLIWKRTHAKRSNMDSRSRSNNFPERNTLPGARAQSPF